MLKLSLAFAHPAFAWMRFDHLHRGTAAYAVLVVAALVSAFFLVRANSS